jgi:hypothetical protein
MNSYLNNRDVSHRESQRWAKDNNEILGSKFFNGTFYKTYLIFKSDFEEWQEQMENNQKSFAPFAKDSDLEHQDGLNKVVGYPPHYDGFILFKKKGYDLIDEKLSNNFRSVPNNLNDASTFMELFYKTTEELCSKNIFKH